MFDKITCAAELARRLVGRGLFLSRRSLASNSSVPKAWYTVQIYVILPRTLYGTSIYLVT
jgi:hypothetical protein